MTEENEKSRQGLSVDVRKQYKLILKQDLTLLAVQGDTDAINLLTLIEQQNQAEASGFGNQYDPDGSKAIQIAATTTTLRNEGKIRPLNEMIEEAKMNLEPKLM